MRMTICRHHRGLFLLPCPVCEPAFYLMRRPVVFGPAPRALLAPPVVLALAYRGSRPRLTGRGA